MKNNDRFDAVLASVPIGGAAARVTAKGEHWTPEQKVPYFHPHWTAPPPLRPFHDPHGTLKNLTGVVVGRFKVSGSPLDNEQLAGD